MRAFLKRINNLNFWIIFPAVVFIFFLMPVITVLSSLLGEYSDKLTYIILFYLITSVTPYFY